VPKHPLKAGAAGAEPKLVISTQPEKIGSHSHQPRLPVCSACMIVFDCAPCFQVFATPLLDVSCIMPCLDQVNK